MLHVVLQAFRGALAGQPDPGKQRPRYWPHSLAANLLQVTVEERVLDFFTQSSKVIMPLYMLVRRAKPTPPLTAEEADKFLELVPTFVARAKQHLFVFLLSFMYEVCASAQRPQLVSSVRCRE